MAEDIDVPFLGDLPLAQGLREAGDVGEPAILQGGAIENAFTSITQSQITQLVQRKQRITPNRNCKDHHYGWLFGSFNILIMVEVKEQVEQALEEIRPFLVNDGGNISLVAIEGDTVIVELEGNCISCSVNQMTCSWVLRQP